MVVQNQFRAAWAGLDNNETTERQQRIVELTFKNKTHVAFRVNLSSRKVMYICKLNWIVAGGINGG